MKKLLLIYILFVSNTSLFCEEKKVFDFSNLKQVLTNDMLDEELAKKKLAQDELERLKKQKELESSIFPEADDYWPFMIELWLVKNMSELKWFFEHPDLGLADSFAELLTKVGLFEIGFEILILDSYRLYHRALPLPSGKILFILSYPFIKSMDLTRKEISLLLFFEFLRLKRSNFVEQAKRLHPELADLYGKSFIGQKPKDFSPKVLTTLSKMIFDARLEFKEQFALVTEMKRYLTSNKEIKTYVDLVKKIEIYIGSSKERSDYVTQTISPQMILKWLGEK